jgi:hypothetical protein
MPFQNGLINDIFFEVRHPSRRSFFCCTGNHKGQDSGRSRFLGKILPAGVEIFPKTCQGLTFTVREESAATFARRTKSADRQTKANCGMIMASRHGKNRSLILVPPTAGAKTEV